MALERPFESVLVVFRGPNLDRLVGRTCGQMSLDDRRQRIDGTLRLDCSLCVRTEETSSEIFVVRVEHGDRLEIDQVVALLDFPDVDVALDR
jgi:hypothetical protein